MVDSISVAKLVVYIILLPPALFVLWRHGKPGFLGWFFVQCFCILRIVTGAIGLSGISSNSATATILNSIGLSPLLLAGAGILIEARKATNPRVNRKMERLMDISFHALVILATVLSIIAILKLQELQIIDSMKAMLKASSALSALAWAALVTWTVCSLVSLHGSGSQMEILTARAGKTLLLGLVIAVSILVIRLAYGIASLQMRVSDPASSFPSNTTAQILLMIIPEILVTMSYIISGILTVSLNADLKKTKLLYARASSELSHDLGANIA
ncbi:unnamed protein product [Clonostachys solani]|uniref:DUF7702 domain-containing protein n=1 Tax=Clonostachys solani TaxID=160281 RepID=A0A9P0EN89_9HYPO|nr:unnamed protein product [Clonostachys solani]